MHSHQEDVVPYSISSVPLQPVWHQACAIGDHVPVWDIRDKFGDTNMLVSNLEQGADLASALGRDKVALMRGHGFVAAGNEVQDAVSTADVFAQERAHPHDREAARRQREGRFAAERSAVAGPIQPETPAFQRGWEYWLTRAGLKR